MDVINVVDVVDVVGVIVEGWVWLKRARVHEVVS